MLHVTDKIDFPLDAITEPMALLAMRGAGKSNAAVVMAEEFHAAGLPWVAIDPKGDWWGIAAMMDGYQGLDIPVFGGLKGHIQIEATAGAFMAETIVDLNLTCVLDLSMFSKGDQLRFLIDFGERLFRLHGEAPHARHIFAEECDDYMPQRGVTGQMARCVGAWTRIVKQGRQRGLGITLISQRSAVVNKDALTQVETMIAMRTTSPQDRKAILGWVDYHAVGRTLVDSLPTLKNGEAWIISPHWLKKIEPARFRQRKTYDSAATPRHGAKKATVTLRDIDLPGLQKALAATIERTESKDPSKLQQRIRALEAEVARLKANPTVVETVKEVHVRVPDERLPGVLAGLRKLVDEMAEGLTGSIDTFIRAAERQAVNPEVVEVHHPSGGVTEVRRAPAPPAPPAPPARVQAPRRAPAAPPNGEKIPKAEKLILSTLAQYQQGRSKTQLALLTGYSATGGGFNNALGALRTKGHITTGDPIQITDEGSAAIEGQWEPMPTGAELREYWKGRVGKCEKLILDYLALVYPSHTSKENLAEQTGYAATGGGFNNALGRLRTLELISRGEPKLADELAG